MFYSQLGCRHVVTELLFICREWVNKSHLKIHQYNNQNHKTSGLKLIKVSRQLTINCICRCLLILKINTPISEALNTLDCILYRVV